MQLKDMPEVLQKVVNEYLVKHDGSKILVLKVYESNPYKDKSLKKEVLEINVYARQY